MRLVKWKRNEIIEAVVAGGLDKRDCTFDFGDSESRITHPPSESSFLIEGDAGNYTSTMIVGDGVPQGPLRHYTWPTVVERCQRWAVEVKRDVETPDLWAELQREREILTGARYEDVENTPFTPDEQAQIETTLQEAKTYARRTYELTEEQYVQLDERLDYLVDASRRLGRLDWRHVVIAVLVEAALNQVLPAPLVRDLLGFALRGLAQLFGGGDIPALPSS